MPPPLTKLAASMKTDIGMVREHNEDSCYLDPKGTYFIVADGMGGHAAGEVASSMAVQEITRSLEAARPHIDAFAANPADEGRQQLVQVLEDAVRRAHQAVYERGGRESDKRGMGTTLDVLLVADGEAFVAHVGDSRTYLLRGGAAAQVTTDHTVAEVLVIEGKLTPEEARLSPLRTILVNAIGVSADVGVELAHLKLRRGDRLLLCSDGLHDYFPIDAEIAEVLAQKGNDDGLVKLVEMAKERGGHDNITGILVEVVEGASGEEGETVRLPRPSEAEEEAKATPPHVPAPSPVAAEPPKPGARSKTDQTQPIAVVAEAQPAAAAPEPKRDPPTPVDASLAIDEDTTEEQPTKGPVTATPPAPDARPPAAEAKPDAKPEAKPEAKIESKIETKPAAKIETKKDESTERIEKIEKAEKAEVDESPANGKPDTKPPSTTN